MTADEDHPMRSDGAELPDLLVEVRRARRRWFLRRSLAGVAWLAAGLGVLSALGAAANAVGWWDAGAPIAWGVLGLAFLVGLIGVLGVVGRNVPSEATMTRWLDDAYGMRSQLVTARDLAAAPPADEIGGVMHRALLARLRSGAPRVRADRFVPIRFRTLHAVALTVAVTSVLAANVMDTWDWSQRDAVAQQGTQGTGSDALDATAREALADELEALAEVLEMEADESSDAYTQALAERARELARDLQGAGAEAAAASARDDVGRLLSHVEDALGSRFAASGGQGASAESERLPSNASLDGEPNVPFADLGLPSPPGSGSDVTEDVRSVRDQLASEQSRRVDDPYGANALSPSGRSGEEIQEAGFIGEAPEGAEGAPAGAARRSTDAAGDAAGGGSQELDVGELVDAGPFELGEDVKLPQTSPADGTRVQASGEADADGDAAVMARGAVDGEAGGASQGDGAAEVGSIDSVRRDAGGWRREALDPHARLLAQRLFEPEPTDARD